jgi:sucrose-6-phosphate hydrolase SacC (GH32 family)
VSPDGRERTDILYEMSRQTLTVQTTTPSIGAMQITQARSVPHPLDAGEALSLRVLLDGSVLEVIVNGRTSLTHRVYPTVSANGLRLAGNRAVVHAFSVWEMPSIWH